MQTVTLFYIDIFHFFHVTTSCCFFLRCYFLHLSPEVRPIHLTVPNVVEISQTTAETSRFIGLHNHRRRLVEMSIREESTFLPAHSLPSFHFSLPHFFFLYSRFRRFTFPLSFPFSLSLILLSFPALPLPSSFPVFLINPAKGSGCALTSLPAEPCQTIFEAF